MGSEEEVSIEAAAAARRERLRALRSAQELLETPDEDKDNNSSQDREEKSHENVQMKFRNYLPQDKHLQEGKLAPPVLPKFNDPVASIPAPEEKEKSEDPFMNIAPKKPNWDLRRDVQKKLDKLEKRTLKALHQLGEEEEKRRLAEE